MTVKDWFEQRKEMQIARRAKETQIDDSIGKLWVKCYNCNSQLLRKDVEENLDVCPKCHYHFRINARTRIKQLFDEGSFEELFGDIKPTDPLEFTDTESYKNRLERAHEKTGLNDAVVTGLASIKGHRLAAAVMDFDFMGGSMGSVVGEKVTRIIEKAIELRLPVLAITSSGGARMQESALSLMQMAKTSCAVSRLDDEGLLKTPIVGLFETPDGGEYAGNGLIVGFNDDGDWISHKLNFETVKNSIRFIQYVRLNGTLLRIVLQPSNVKR